MDTILILLPVLLGLLCLVKLFISSIKHKMYGGAVSIVGFVSLLFNYVKRACCLILDKMGSIGFPATLDKVQNSTVEKVDYLEQAARGIPWIYASAIVLLIGLIWLICDIVRRKKSAT